MRVPRRSALAGDKWEYGDNYPNLSSEFHYEMPANVAGRHGITPLASLSYFDLHLGYLLPWIHARWAEENDEEFLEALTSRLHRSGTSTG